MQFVRLDDSFPSDAKALTAQWNPNYGRMEILLDSKEWPDNHCEGNPVECVKVYRGR